MKNSIIMFEEFSQRMPFLEIEKRLCAIYKYHETTDNKHRVHEFLLEQFEKSKREIKVMVYEYLKKMRHEITRVNLNIVEMLKSSDLCIRNLSLRFVRTFWRLYEYDEVVVYMVRRHRMFYRLFGENPKYRLVYKARIAACGQFKTKRHKTKEYAWLEDGVESLKARLEGQMSHATFNEKKILKFFIEKINARGEDGVIPGIEMGQKNSLIINGVDGLFELELLGIDSSPLFKRIENVMQIR